MWHPGMRGGDETQWSRALPICSFPIALNGQSCFAVVHGWKAKASRPEILRHDPGTLDVIKVVHSPTLYQRDSAIDPASRTDVAGHILLDRSACRMYVEGCDSLMPRCGFQIRRPGLGEPRASGGSPACGVVIHMPTRCRICVLLTRLRYLVELMAAWFAHLDDHATLLWTRNASPTIAPSPLPTQSAPTSFPS